MISNLHTASMHWTLLLAAISNTSFCSPSVTYPILFYLLSSSDLIICIRGKLVDSKDDSKILLCCLKYCNLHEQRSKAHSSSSKFLGVQRDRDCNFEKPCSTADGSKDSCGRKSNLSPALDETQCL